MSKRAAEFEKAQTLRYHYHLLRCQQQKADPSLSLRMTAKGSE
jgi:hypothetical protein